MLLNNVKLIRPFAQTSMCIFILILLYMAIGCNGGGKVPVIFVLGEELIIPVVSGDGISGTIVDLDDDGNIDGIDINDDLSTCELVLINSDDPVYAFDSDDDGMVDLYLKINSPAAGKVTMNTTPDMTGDSVSVVLNGNGSAVALDNNGDGIADICIVSVTSAGDIIAPTVETVSPAEDATDIAINNTLTAMFNECMDSSTITTTTFTLFHETESIDGVAVYNEDFNIAVFTPSENMKPDSIYTATLETGITDNSGNGLSESKNWSFTTGTVEDTTPPVPGNSAEIIISETTATTLTLSWSLAEDVMSWQEDLMYKVILSTSDNISTVSDAEAVGGGKTVLQDWTADINTLDVTNLTGSTTYYFNILVRDVALNKAIYSRTDETTIADVDTTAPEPGNSGTLTSANVTTTSLTLNWTAATDNESTQANLDYLAYFSTSNNINSVSDCEANGNAIGVYTENIETKSVPGLSASTTYYFNIIVKDESGNKAIYNTLSQATVTPPETTPPTPGNSGTITAASVASTSLTLNWTAATDNASAQGNLQYLAYYSTSNNITSVANCESNGTAVGSYVANIATKSVTGLSDSTTYYFNVVVQDEAGNKTAYSTLTQATTDGTAPTAGNSGTVTAAIVAPTSLTLNWTAATDSVSAQANLQYLAYYSTSNNITSVANCESNGTAVGSYVANIATKSVTGLSDSTTYYFNVVVQDEAGNKTAYSTLTQATTDGTAPTAGNSGTVTAASVAPTSLTLNWTAATDSVSAQANLQYLAYYSTSNNITSVANCESNGTAVGSYVANIATKSVTGLSDSTTYYFNVVVQDEAGNKTAYSTLTQATTDGTAPTAGNSGTVTAASVASTSLTLNWTAATDSVSTQANLQYLAYYSTSNNITSVANCESNGTAVGSYTANIATKGVTGLSSSTTYYFNVVVRDEAGNKSAYSTLTQATSDVTNPTAGNSGTITAASVASTSLTLNWTAGTDDFSAQANLEYLAYYSTSNNIVSVANCESNGTAVGTYAANIATKDVSGLTASTTYYFNVVVKDQADNKAAYSTLTQATAAGLPSDFVFRWKLNNNGYDEKSSINLFASTGSPAYSTSSPKEGTHYLVVDGDDDIYGASYNVTTNAITISAWLYLDASYVGSNPTAVDLNGMGLYYNGGRLKGGTGVNYAQTNADISTNTWYHVVMTWNGTAASIYLNGNSTPVETYSYSDDITVLNAPWYIGSNATANDWDGYIDDVIVYSRAISGAEVAQIYSTY